MQQTPAGDTDACKLDKSTQELIKLIFDTDMFNDALKNMEIGTYEQLLCFHLYSIQILSLSCIEDNTLLLILDFKFC